MQIYVQKLFGIYTGDIINTYERHVQPGKVNSGDDTQKAYRDINNIDGIFALSARKYHYIAVNGRQIYDMIQKQENGLL